MRRSATTGFGIAAILFALLTGGLALVGLFLVLGRYDLTSDQRANALVATVTILAVRGALLLAGVLLLCRARYAGLVLWATLLLALCQVAWMFAFVLGPASEGVSDAFAAGRAVGRVLGALLIPGFCASALVYLRMPRTRAEFAATRGTPPDSGAASDSARV